jgi:rubrerythrin
MKKNTFLIYFLSIILSLTISCKAKDDAKSKTIENLKTSITGETTASQKYAAYAKKAKEEGYLKIAILFAAASKSEQIHAIKHTAVLQKLGVKMENITPKYEVKSTKENLADAIKGESHEINLMYPGFIKTASDIKMDDAVMTFNAAYNVEKRHLELYTAAIEALDKKNLKSLPDSYAVCPVCGNTFGKTIPANCEICGVEKAKFIIVKSI